MNMKKWIMVVALTSLLTSLTLGCSGRDGGSGAVKEEEAPPPAKTQLEHNGTEAGAETNKADDHLDEEKHVADIDKLSPFFGFANADGSQIIVTGQEAGLETSLSEYDHIIGEGGKTYGVRFAKWQTGSDQSNGRDTANNFANLEGYVFNVLDGKAAPNETYYVVKKQDFDLESLLEITSPAPTGTDVEPETEETLKENISLMRDRDVAQLWTLAGIGSDRKLYLVRFEDKGKDRLFSIALFNGENFLFRDYPAVAEDDISVWRVDDGGEVSPDMFPPLLAAETKQGLLLGMSWWGAEGVNSFFLLEDGENLGELDIKYGRYTSP